MENVSKRRDERLDSPRWSWLNYWTSVQKTVSCYERGLQSPWDAQKIELSNILHISIDYLLGLSDISCPPLKGKHVIEIDEDLTEEELAELRGVVRDWLAKHTKEEK